MKNLKKALAAVMALSVMSWSCAAFADVSATGAFSGGNGAVSADYSEIGDNKVTATVDTNLANVGTEMTFLILDDGTNVASINEADILYIDQQTLTAGNNSFTGVINLARVDGGTGAEALPEGSYPIRVGYYYNDNGEQTFGLAAATMVVSYGSGEEPKITIIWGDITLDNNVNLSDALAALYYSAGTPKSYPASATEEIEAGQFTVGDAVGGITWGDITLDGNINLSDALAALYYSAGTPKAYEGYTVGDEVEITLSE